MLRKRRPMMAEINVTPFVDVMLVLLVIFMITAPLMQHSLEVQLPQESTEPVQVKEDAEGYGRDKVRRMEAIANGLKELDGGSNHKKQKLLVAQDALATSQRQQRVLKHGVEVMKRGQQLAELKLDYEIASPDSKPLVKDKLKALIRSEIPPIGP